MQVEKRTINAVHEAQEKSQTLERDDIKQIWEESAAEIDDEMPDDPPVPDDVELDGYRTGRDLDDQDVPLDQVTPRENGDRYER